MSHDYVEPAPVDRSLTRAERRRLARGEGLGEAVTGRLGCKFCKSTKGRYEKRGNRFFCTTTDCKGN